MGILEGQREAWVREHGPWLYWCNWKTRLWPWILRDGIQPPSATGQSGMHAGMPSRPGHVYFLTEPTPRARLAANAGTEPQARVNIRDLDLDRLATDEDRVNYALSPPAHQARIWSLPGFRDLPDRPGKERLAAWMNEHAAVVDQPAWVLFSMEHRTVAYRGGVAISQVDIIAPYICDDWEPACPGESFVEQSIGTPAAHYKGPPKHHPR